MNWERLAEAPVAEAFFNSLLWRIFRNTGPYRERDLCLLSAGSPADSQRVLDSSRVAPVPDSDFHEQNLKVCSRGVESEECDDLDRVS